MKYSQHDRVIYNGKKAKILTGWTLVKGTPKYRLEFDDGKTLEVMEDKIAADESNPWESSKVKKKGTDTDAKCPQCGCEWKVTVFNSHKWYDCVYCKKTKEDIIKNYKEKDIAPTPYYLGMDWMD